MTAQPTTHYWTPPVSPEWEPAPPLRFTGVALRSIALAIDLTLVAIYSWLLLTAPALRAWNGPVLATLLVAPPAAYFILGWGRFGATLGMRLLNLRIVLSRDGSRIGYLTATVRFGLVTVSLCAILFLIGGILILPMVIDRRRRAIHDLISGTVVIRPGWNRRVIT
ncbi:hypothetical protein BH23CHL7_BH23CHL7_23680 [soil metagenome]